MRILYGRCGPHAGFCLFAVQAPPNRSSIYRSQKNGTDVPGETVFLMEEEKQSQLNEILPLYIAKRQVPVAIGILDELYQKGCVSRSGKQAFLTDIKLEDVPRATLYRVASRLESLGLIDRESKFSGYFLSHGFSNRRESEAAFWRRLIKLRE